MKIVLFLAFLGLSCALGEKKRYDGNKLFHTVPTIQEQYDVLNSLKEITRLDFWSDTDINVAAEDVEMVLSSFDSVGMYYEVAIENVQDELDAEEAMLALRSRDAKAYDLYNFNTYDQIVEAINDIAANCPSGYSCEIVSMGSSYNGNDVPALTIRSGNNKPLVYLDSLIHCREWLAGTTTLLLADRLINGNDGEAERLRSSYNWYIAPVINPDGYMYTWSTDRLWRKNREPNSGSTCVGTDLNRNFDIKWRYAGTSALPCSDLYGGPSAGSAIETQNVQNKLMELSTSDNLYGVVSYHMYANMWLHAYGYTTVAGGSTCALPSEYNKINAVSLAARNAIETSGGQRWTHGPVCSTITPASGSTVDYAYDVCGLIHAYTPELRGTSFTAPASEISPNYLEQWAALVAMVDAIAVNQ